MKNEKTTAAEQGRLVRHLSPLAVWALAFGCSVGWGAFVMPGNTFLPIAGPLGTAIGIGLGALIMFVIGTNYAFLMNRYPDAGGTFSYTKNVFGYDHAFLSSWFMGLVYLAIIWANCTALPLIFSTLFGNVLQFGAMYTIAGGTVYAGEVMLSVAAILVFGLICMRGGKVSSWVQISMALVLIVGILVALGFVVLFRDGGAPAANFQPSFANGISPVKGILFIVCLSPWAFAGFESVSQSAEEFKFPVKKSLGIMASSLVTGAAAYIILSYVAASAVPEGSGLANWAEYVNNNGFDGVQGKPVFNGVFEAAGNKGLLVLGLAVAAGIITGLVGNMIAMSRLLCSVARDDVISPKLGRLNRFGVPQSAVLAIVVISLIIPFFGRSAIMWVVDINTIGVIIAYAYTSAAAFKEALAAKKKLPLVTGGAGVLVSLFFLVYYLIPNDWSAAAGAILSTQSYFMLLLWILLGFVVFYFIFRHDKAMRIGKSTFSWVVLLLLLFFTSVIWVSDTAEEWKDVAIEQFNAGQISLGDALGSVTGKLILGTIVLYVMVIAVMIIIFNIYGRVQKQHQSAVEEKQTAEESSHAKTTFLSNMSHDIRTPMNAIIGYVTLAKREKDIPPAVSAYLSKIEASSDHLLALINDVLEMSRIESGKMEIAPVPSDLTKLMEETKNLFSTQMETKGVEFVVSCQGVRNARVLCDANRLNRVLLNLVSNAYKFTPAGGKVTVSLEETGLENDVASFVIRVKDTGIGMSPEFAARVFEAYERERTSTVESIQGTGLGTAITKSIVDLMGGTIQVFSEQGKGSEFVVKLSFPVDPDAAKNESAEAAAGTGKATFEGLRLLLVEDNPENLEVAKTMFEELGFTVDAAVNGEEAVETIASVAPGRFAAVIMDIEMPVKNGYEAARLIRSLKNPELARIPIVALSAKAFSEDIAAAREAGMNAHVAKPVNLETLRKTMTEVLG